jgi:hypothetical protein
VLAVAGEQPDRHRLLRPEFKYVGNTHGNEVLNYRVWNFFLSNVL